MLVEPGRETWQKIKKFRGTNESDKLEIYIYKKKYKSEVITDVPCPFIYVHIYSYMYAGARRIDYQIPVMLQQRLVN